MSIFDVIRYSNTDLDSEEELSKLPDGLFRAYQYAAYDHFGSSLKDVIHKYSMEYQYNVMAIKWSLGNDKLKQQLFKKVLRQWNNESI